MNKQSQLIAMQTTDPSSASLQLMRCLYSPIYVLREHCTCQSITSIVCLPYHVVVVLKFDHDSNGAEDLLPHDFHVGLRVGEDGGLDGVPLGAMAIAARLHRLLSLIRDNP